MKKASKEVSYLENDRSPVGKTLAEAMKNCLDNSILQKRIDITVLDDSGTKGFWGWAPSLPAF
jgi:hypothetical protein